MGDNLYKLRFGVYSSASQGSIAILVISEVRISHVRIDEARSMNFNGEAKY